MREYLRLFFFLFTMAKTFEKQYIEMKDISEKKKLRRNGEEIERRRTREKEKKIGEQVGSVRGERGDAGRRIDK